MPLSRQPLGVLAVGLSACVLLLGAAGVLGSHGVRLSENVGAGTTSSPGASYGWPFAPFFRQHPVRGMFGDPRIVGQRDGRIDGSLHFGVDVVAANGTPVYATLTGSISIHPLHSDAVMVSDGTGRVFEYWHVVPTRTTGRAIAYQTVVGHVERPWAHVHFAERMGSRYTNPLRPGAMGPYFDPHDPVFQRITFEREGHDSGRVLGGYVDVIIEAYDPPPMAVPAPWSTVRLTPSLVQWRLVRPGVKPSGAWHVAYDTRGALPLVPLSSVFAPGTQQNRASRAGRYRIYLVRGWDTRGLSDGPHLLQVSVSDMRDHRTTSVIPFRTGNL